MPIDICIPKNNEEELLKRAKELGYSEIVFLYGFKSKAEILNKKNEIKKVKSGLKVYVGAFILARSVSDIKKLQNLYLDADLIAVSAQNEDLVRFASEQAYVDVVFGVTTAFGKDHFQYRRSNFNAVIANMMREGRQAYALSFAHLLSFSGAARAKILGREIQNIYFARRKIPIITASFASDVWQMRLPENLSAVLRVLGANYPQSKAATSTAIEGILKRKEQRRSKNFVRAGVKLVSRQLFFLLKKKETLPGTI